ncbi:N-alkane-inducible cytochrome P450 [Pyrenochaeta sp. MPI-SDFR-AT-0127]|nr:N-alkane-inducible cytochrome P450 [Pyrenochaeta sp. MPI-SDFR-AT-0127]
MAIFSLTNVVVSLATIYIAHRLYWEATIGTRRRSLSKQRSCLPARKRINDTFPTFLPTFGLDFVVGNYRAIKAHRLLSSWVQDLSNAGSHTIATSVLGVNLFITDDPENVKTLLATDFDTWSLGKERIEQMSSYLGHGIFTNEGKAWKYSREMLRPCFEKSAVADVSILEKHTERLFNLLPTDGSTVDLQPLFHELTLDIATEFLFGRSTNSLDRGEESKEVQEFIEAFEYCSDPFMSENHKKYGYIGLLIPDKKRKRSIKLIQDFTDKVIDEELASKASQSNKPDNRYIFLDELTTTTSSRPTIRAELLNILLAGRDTTAALLSNLIWELPRQPAILARLRLEIAENVGDDNAPTYTQLKNMKYLRAIVNESQRLYPIVPTNSREALHDTTLPHGSGPDGASPILIPKGSYVAYHTFGMHRRADIFGVDADTFSPDRWLEPGFRPGWAYIPFSGGPRVCIGQNFALTEAMFVIVRLLQRFELERKDFEEWREKISITCTGDGGCKVGLRRRI